MSYVRDTWTSENPEWVPGSSKKKRLRNDRWGKGKRWQAVWMERGREVVRTFAVRDEAAAYLEDVGVAQRTGSYIVKANQGVTVAEVWPLWWATKEGKAKDTKAGYAASWKHIEPRWGNVACSAVERTEFTAWAARLKSKLKDDDGKPKPLGEAGQRKVAITMNGILNTAVEKRIITANPLKMSDAPQQKESARRYLSVEELDRLLDAMPTPEARLVVEVLARTGIRPGECFGLWCGDLNGQRGRLRISRDVDDLGTIDDTKTGRHRDVPVGGDLLLDLENAAEGRDHTDWLLRTPDGHGWNTTRWRRVWKAATKKAGLEGLQTYELRHTAASLAMHSGANIMTIQRMLGHAKPAITLNIYSHLWDAELDALPKAMDKHFKRERKLLKKRKKRAATEQGPSRAA